MYLSVSVFGLCHYRYDALAPDVDLVLVISVLVDLIFRDLVLKGLVIVGLVVVDWVVVDFASADVVLVDLVLVATTFPREDVDCEAEGNVDLFVCSEDFDTCVVC